MSGRGYASIFHVFISTDIKLIQYNYAVCDGTFFPSLLNEMSEIVGCFNERAQRLLDLHLASGIRKYFFWIKGMLQGNHAALIQEGKDLTTYALINATAIRKILKKYDKVCLLLINVKCVYGWAAYVPFFLYICRSWMQCLSSFHIALISIHLSYQISYLYLLEWDIMF